MVESVPNDDKEYIYDSEEFEDLIIDGDSFINEGAYDINCVLGTRNCSPKNMKVAIDVAKVKRERKKR